MGNNATQHQVIAISDLKPGMVIVQITAQNGPVKIRKSGLVSSAEMVQGLMEMGVQQVEIDPAQTVELEVTIPKSTMQSILMDNQRGQTLDSGLSEQFNRSLFLPSVSGIPSSWQYYGRQVLMVVVVIAGGLGLGWTAATHEQWLSAFETPVQQAPQLNPLPAAVSVQSAATTPSSTTQPVAKETSATGEEAITAVVEPAVSLQELAQEPAQVIPKEAQQAVSQRENEISPELLKKFNQAVATLSDRQDVQPAPQEMDRDASVPRIDQLPAWVLAELPPLAFSAHMYSSEFAERWVTLNDVRLYEGDWFDDNLQVQEIQPQQVILNYRSQQFSMNALSQW
ncbi:general secretion pathway protein GspB [Alteromonadaceae bacterium BrNp21-10]|nr:general secretion pathway protein GspB [Alteromonadaceae bacterium BrNp21-10]